MGDNSPVLEHEVFGISWYCAELLAVATQNLRVECVLTSTTVAKLLHYRVDLLLEYLSKLLQNAYFSHK